MFSLKFILTFINLLLNLFILINTETHKKDSVGDILNAI